MKKLLLLCLLLCSCTPELYDSGIVSEVSNRPGFSSTKYRVTASLNAGGYKREVIIYTNTLYQVGDTVKIVKK